MTKTLSRRGWLMGVLAALVGGWWTRRAEGRTDASTAPEGGVPVDVAVGFGDSAGPSWSWSTFLRLEGRLELVPNPDGRTFQVRLLGPGGRPVRCLAEQATSVALRQLSSVTKTTSVYDCHGQRIEGTDRPPAGRGS